MKKVLQITILLVLAFSLVKAQDKKGPGPEIFEKIKAEKISFFTAKMNFTPAEAQAFWPVYNEYEKKSFDIQRQRHDFERMPDDKVEALSNQEMEKITKSYIESFELEGNLRKEYHKKFHQILPLKKVLLMYRAENDFRLHLIREFKRGPKEDK
jgi:hypothetical protein